MLLSKIKALAMRMLSELEKIIDKHRILIRI